ncbi:TonB-dependent receptor plug domain-containing protein [Aquimarina hainanensis]|uniref:TonB-dependent receptor plug domain-containing protein n=1 Tax=Aquimarina hainanensis TaxID=1578017 RepID=A0ABW5N419_9FLAO|nr:TonB-dependent receptor [Aquimarina sp. TRL1]
MTRLKSYLFLSLGVLTAPLFAQENKPQDSLNIERLDKVVVTGQYNPQSAKKSVFEVKTITRSEIENQAGNNLADILNTTLNLNIIPNTSSGKSGVSLFGLDGQYFKVLIDNIPVINEEGVGNNTDLTLINLDDIERVEIVEGSMGVQYGSNAVSGIINIITKKQSIHNWEIDAYIQEETVGEEYELFDKGRHVQSIKIGHNLTDEIYWNASYTHNDFGGFWNDHQGKNYDKDDGLRGHEWLPKEQHNGNLLVNLSRENHRFFYKFNYFNERIEKFDKTVNLNPNAATQTIDPVGLDEIFTNNRYYHHINGFGTISGQANYNISVSYQQQQKDLERYTYRIRKDQKLNRDSQEYLKRSALFSRGTFNNIISSNTLSLQAGYELTLEEGNGSPFAITIAPGQEEVKRSLDNYDIFASSEINLSDRFSIRPGARISFSSIFENQYTGSLSSKYLFKNNIELRTVIGTANRTPNYNELFTYFVDVNHNIQGNPGLDPEQGVSAFIHLKKQSWLANDKLILSNKISASYLGLKDRIELIVVNRTPLAYQYNNIDSYKSFGVFSENTLRYGTFSAQVGGSLLGISKILDSKVNSKDDFLYNLQLNANLEYSVPKWKTVFGVYFKHIGQQHQFREETNEEGNQVFVKGTTDAYSWMNTTIRKSFLSNKIHATFGIRNLFDVRSIDTNALSGGAHSGRPTSIPIAYGRSYFLKLAYDINL